MLKDLSKAFDCLSYELLLEKLHAYGFSFADLQLGHSYLRNRKQGTNLNPKKKILFGVPQRSKLGHLFFHIFLCGMFFVMSNIDFGSYADDNTPYVAVDCIKMPLENWKMIQPSYSNGFLITRCRQIKINVTAMLITMDMS